ncbi:uncharacterized protein MONBRDRAFT_11127 [Monosiga brevicollis MX1]|uniref:TsaA-like domain-containing protein n=1 Tax=Monosiga brevicollis TaxID=81824 RepID=A9V8A2_MONBE|nr:uncharacterized protein MONBRDRAFT_11127 [Monosiga brevicollis MX1]EDQ86234.1 predicted protein [Monosiga brevicollis MX1]|eukprot:XP_001748904.1 hypothetical protein [Monosiga brevicollis MX1]
MVGVLMAWRVERKRVKELQALLDRMERLRKEERTGRAAGIAIAGHDLVDGTPVLDIKPYLPHVEAVQDATLPAWVDEENTLLAMSVDWLPAALDQLAQSCTHLPSKIPWRHPATPAQASATLLRRQIDQILRFDIRNLNQRQRAAPETTYHLRYAGLNLAYHIQDRRITIHACSLSSTSD